MYIKIKWQEASHQPVIKAVMELYKPQFVLELGVGIYSTPLLCDTWYLGVDNDREWIDYVQEKYYVHLQYHDLGDVDRSMVLSDLSLTQMEKIYEYYFYSVDVPIVKTSLLFVDNYASCRAIAMSVFHKLFPLVIFHDCEPTNINCYDKVDLSERNMMCLKTNYNWTGLLYNEDKGIKKTVEKYIKEFMKEHPDCDYMTI